MDIGARSFHILILVVISDGRIALTKKTLQSSAHFISKIDFCQLITMTAQK